ncbi:MAG TPA: hypothetical protein VK466_11245 [Terriglobales bacterium]|nr:hypothetical protein [Terriglobales bacterium]
MRDEDVARNALIRRYSAVVTIALIVLCNAVFLFGVWASGVNLEELIKTPDLFNPKSDVCLRLTWQRLTGAQDPLRLCSEWINLADQTGQAHTLDKNTRVRQGADGRYYVDPGIRADFRLMGYVGFVGMVLVSGVLTRRYLVNRYRGRLESAARAR